MPIKINNTGGQDFDPIPAGVHQAVCYGVVDIGTHDSRNPAHKPARQVILLFELPHERADFGDKKNLPRGTSLTLTQSLADKAWFRRHLKSWRGRDFTPQELEGFDPKVLIGVNCQLAFAHENAKNGSGKVYSNITAVMPIGKGMPKMAQENKSLYFSLDDIDLKNFKLPENMPQWIQAKVQSCKEVNEANGGGGTLPRENEESARASHEEEARKHDAASRGDQQSYAPAPAPAPQDDLDEEVPF